MAENEAGQEKTEEPSAKRLREAREKGLVPQSRDLNSMAVTVAGAATLLLLGGPMMDELRKLVTRGLSPDRRLLFEDPVKLWPLFLDFVADGLLIVLPVLLATMVAALVAAGALAGLNFSSEAVSFKPERLNPVNGFKRILSAQNAVELPKTLAKFLLVLVVALMTMWSFADELLRLGREPLEFALSHAGRILTWGFLFMACALILIATVDVPFQLWNYRRQQRMTRKEVKDEHKDMEGNPEIKSRVRRLQMEMAHRRMMAEVPKADVIVTNPTHFAVALRYEQGRMSAPRVVAKGADLIAAQIRELATAHQVPVFSAPPLARALYFNVRLGQEIPAGLFIAVAQVLAYVYQLKAATDLGGVAPVPPDELPVPDEFLRRDPSRGEA